MLTAYTYQNLKNKSHNRPRAILPASSEQITILPSHTGNNCIVFNEEAKTTHLQPAALSRTQHLETSTISHRSSLVFPRRIYQRQGLTSGTL